MTDRITISLDEQASSSLENLNDERDASQSEIVRDAIVFYEENYESSNSHTNRDLNRIYEMVASGEHVILDVDLLYLFLERLYQDGEFDSDFIDEVDQVADYHTQEFSERFDTIGELLEWLSFCGFITMRQETNGVYHIVFPSNAVQWFMIRFIKRSSAGLNTDLEIEPSVSKALIIAKNKDSKG